jgi:hypothetical protein
MTHLALSAAVHELGLQYGSRDTHTSECITVGRRERAPYYYAQVWFSREGKGEVTSVMGDTAEAALRNLRGALDERLNGMKPMHPMARHAAMLMAAEVEQ